MIRIALSILALTSLWLACSGTTTYETGDRIDITPGPAAQQRVENVLRNARFGDIIYFSEGLYEFDASLRVSTANVTLRGGDADRTILSFSGVPTRNTPGIIATDADSLTIEDLAIEDTTGPALELRGGADQTIRRVRFEWAQPSVDRAQGVHALGCHNLLIEDSLIVGSSVEGIAALHSENIVVRHNELRANEVGIHMENSGPADIHDNNVTGNVAGIMVSNMPIGPEDPDFAEERVASGQAVRVFANDIRGNNKANRVQLGNFLDAVPSGTGVLLVTGQEIEMFANDIGDHRSFNLGIVSFPLLNAVLGDPEFSIYSHTIDVHGNRFGSGGDDVDDTEQFGRSLQEANAALSLDQTPTILFDGFVDRQHSAPGQPDLFQDEYNLCLADNDFEDNGGALPFINYSIPEDYGLPSDDISPHDCSHPALPAVDLDT